MSMSGSARVAVIAVSIWGVATCAGAVADPPAATQPAKRAMPAIVQDINEAMTSINEFNPGELTDEAKRKEIAPKMLPKVKKITALADELAANEDPRAKEGAAQLKGQFMSVRVVLGDKEATDLLEAQAKSTNSAEALAAKGSLLTAHWLLSHNDAPAQVKLADEAVALAKANPADNNVTMTLMTMTQMGSSNSDVTGKIEEALSGMTSEIAQKVKPMIEAHRKLAALENKPMTIKGVKNGGGEFSTDAWKGKVILIDFWATWCGPCLQELPRVKKAYATWHEKGLEVLGVSCDNDGAKLTSFLKENPDMPWPQLFDAKTPGWHPIATGFGIDGIPTMFLIDKKGVCRTVEARSNFEELIPKLLEEGTK